MMPLSRSAVFAACLAVCLCIVEPVLAGAVITAGQAKQELVGQKAAQSANPSANAALYRDPVHDGVADPAVVWNRTRKSWWMLYTDRRANMISLKGVSWEYGTKIGIAESRDGGAHWQYRGVAAIPYGKPDYSFWAPEVIYSGGLYHMFVTIVPGTFSDWGGPRNILHLTSTDLQHWRPLALANLVGDRTIDPCLFHMPDGEWRMWYKNATDHGRIYFSDSNDLVHWSAKGIAITSPGEGPVVFQWRGAYWLIEDAWSGLAVFRSADLTHWLRQPDNLLREPGTRPTDRAPGAHPDVVVDGAGKAWLFYFTPQSGADAKPGDPFWKRRTVMHVTEIHERGGVLTVDRNAGAAIQILPPRKDKKSDGVAVRSAAMQGD